MALSIMTLSTTTLSAMTLRLMTLGIKWDYDIQQNNTQDDDTEHTGN